MTFHDGVSLAAASGQLGLGLMIAVRRARGRTPPTALPLALLCFDLFLWNSADLAYDAQRDLAWKLLDHSFSPFTAPLFLHFILAFSGRRRPLGGMLIAAYAVLGALAATSLLGFVVAPAAAFQRTDAWSLILLGLSLPVVLLAVVVLVGQLRRSPDLETRRRGRLILVAACVAVPLAVTDLLDGVVAVPIPPLANVATLAAVALLAVATLRFRLFGEDLSTSLITVAGAFAVSLVLSYAALFNLLRRHPAAWVVATAAILALIAGLTMRMTWAGVATRRARATELMTLGRYAAQVAHDLKNPLAAVSGAVQFLVEERRRGSLPPETLDRFLALIAAQTTRMSQSLDEVGRLGRVDPDKATVAANDLVRETAALVPLAADRLDLRLELADGLPAVPVDRALVLRALDNLVKNAVEAMPGGGTLTLRTALDGGRVVLAVADTGQGMDPATLEQAIDDFFTTKPDGSGLGLSFVRRVALAHGGDLRLTSRPGEGTSVEILLPAEGG